MKSALKKKKSRELKKFEEFFQKDLDYENLKLKLKSSENKYNFRENEKYLYENISKSDPSEILEKFVILGVLIDPFLKNYIKNNTNPFQITIFNEILLDFFKNDENLIKKYLEIEEKYEIVINKYQNNQIEKIKSFMGSGRDSYISCL